MKTFKIIIVNNVQFQNVVISIRIFWPWANTYNDETVVDFLLYMKSRYLTVDLIFFKQML